LRISSLALSRITSSLQVDIGNSGQRVNLGLNLKFDAKGKKVLGYSRKTDKGWEYSDKALALINEYRSAFPVIFSRLGSASTSDYYIDTDFFPKNPKEAIAKVSQWLKDKKIKQLLAVPLNSMTLTKETVDQLESFLDDHNARMVESGFEPIIVKGVPRKVCRPN
jgi:5'-3' exoribonuclease 1